MTYSQEKQQEILAMYDGGLAITNIAEEIGAHPDSIKAVLDAHGRDLDGALIEDWEMDLIVDYKNGILVSEILQKYDVSHTKMYTILAEHGVQLRRRTRKAGRDMAKKQAVQMYRDGFKIAEITAETGVAQPTLHTLLRKRGVPLRRP